ncbi:hydroxypyruvate reductase [Roseovarius azorensis]|uniref:Hydroxypyruvate reductase n=1 Tax=Roseovarius azorensis TaxID=1287727 RepID=A0A1H7P1R7_9RHOB|nr:DUF4147 domain-containing protein [Roseovarius azorensis]SEL29549.1 hydroxypyruvate reductase [Roseovarius azorensis]
MNSLREIALSLFRAAVDQADPARALRRHWQANRLPDLGTGRCFVVAIGKAAVPMMQAALDSLPRVDHALVVTNAENAVPLTGASIMLAAHPVPDETSVAAGRAVTALLQKAGQGDRVLALISGGGSALMAAPAGDISLADFSHTNAVLLASGLEITQMNLIRQQIDSLKGGGFLRQAAPAKVYGYLLSDVIDDDLRAIASGPTVSPIGTREDAIALLRDAGLWDAVPEMVRYHLQVPSPSAMVPQAINHLIGSNRHSLQAMLSAVPEGLAARIANDRLEGDVCDAAEQILRNAEDAQGPVALIFGGETTVQVRGTGLGGRNQELALRVAMGAEDRLAPGWVFLSGGTDGRDGPTEAAGGVVDEGTPARIRAAGRDPAALLASNDSYAALKLSEDLLITGGTGTNVADVQVFLRPAP